MTTDTTTLVAEIREAGQLDQADFEKRISELEAEHGPAAMSAAYEALHEIGAREAGQVHASADSGMRGATDEEV
ncbi:hypothetical protein AB0N99_30725 [Streptomyces sp. NPDC093272]|uniref:hypothetical protein n=1 Tax=Streptomyces sp. NPDC093272 TaxID=3154981 RepID=UPI0034125CD0